MNTSTSTLHRTLIAGAMLVAVGLAGCGSEEVDAVDIDSAPRSASVEDFCEVWNDDTVAADATPEEYADSLHEAAGELAEVGTPKALGESERIGFETFVSLMADIDADGVERFQGATGPGDFKDAFGLASDEGQHLVTFLAYASSTCA